MVGANTDDIRQYLAGVGMGPSLVEHTEGVLATIRRFLLEEPEFIFVCDYRDEEGNRNYTSLWVLTESYLSEAREFVNERNFDMIRRDSGLSHILVEYEDFDFAEHQDSSRLTVKVSLGRFGSGLSGTFVASGGNCGDLQQILENYLLPTLRQAGGAETTQ